MEQPYESQVNGMNGGYAYAQDGLQQGEYVQDNADLQVVDMDDGHYRAQYPGFSTDLYPCYPLSLARSDESQFRFWVD